MTPSLSLLLASDVDGRGAHCCLVWLQSALLFLLCAAVRLHLSASPASQMVVIVLGEWLPIARALVVHRIVQSKSVRTWRPRQWTLSHARRLGGACASRRGDAA